MWLSHILAHSYISKSDFPNKHAADASLCSGIDSLLAVEWFPPFTTSLVVCEKLSDVRNWHESNKLTTALLKFSLKTDHNQPQLGYFVLVY